jgi:hypothetical protein
MGLGKWERLRELVCPSTESICPEHVIMENNMSESIQTFSITSKRRIRDRWNRTFRGCGVFLILFWASKGVVWYMGGLGHFGIDSGSYMEPVVLGVGTILTVYAMIQVANYNRYSFLAVDEVGILLDSSRMNYACFVPNICFADIRKLRIYHFETLGTMRVDVVEEGGRMYLFSDLERMDDFIDTLKRNSHNLVSITEIRAGRLMANPELNAVIAASLIMLACILLPLGLRHESIKDFLGMVLLILLPLVLIMDGLMTRSGRPLFFSPLLNNICDSSSFIRSWSLGEIIFGGFFLLVNIPVLLMVLSKVF